MEGPAQEQGEGGPRPDAARLLAQQREVVAELKMQRRKERRQQGSAAEAAAAAAAGTAAGAGPGVGAADEQAPKRARLAGGQSRVHSQR